MLPPERYPGAVESIPLVVDLVDELRSVGAAYEIDGDIYFAVTADREFGQISGLPRSVMLELFAERGGDPGRPGKKDPLDSLLWSRARAGEPAWDSPFGSGRPGWHVECAAIALAELGAGFDVQGGGRDLVFPHHEMSASVSQVATGQWPFAQAYVHAGMVGLDGEKMSKSQGNLVFVSACAMPGPKPARSGWPCWPTTTAATGTGRRRSRGMPKTAWPDGGRRRLSTLGLTPAYCWPRCDRIWLTTWTPRRTRRRRPVGRARPLRVGLRP